MLHPSYVELMKVVNKNSDEIGEEPVVNSRYSIVCATAKRARQIIGGHEPMVKVKPGEKPLSIAVDELNQRKIKILGEDGEEVDLKDDDDDDSIYGAGGKALPDDEITMDDDLPNGKDVDADEAADAGFEIQDEDNVFGLLNDSYTMDSDDSENV